MKTIDERAKEYEESIGAQDYTSVEIEDAYFKGATEQKAIDIKTIRDLHCSKCGFPTHCDLCEIGQILKVLERE